MDRFMGKPVPLKSLKDLSQCKPVMEMSSLLDTKHRKSCDSIQALAEELSEGSVGSKSSRSSKSSSNANSTFSKHSCLIVSKATDPSITNKPVKIITRPRFTKHGGATLKADRD